MSVPLSLRVLGISVVGMALLTACPGPTPPLSGSNLTFTFPSLADTSNVQLVALGFEQTGAGGDPQRRVVAQTPIGYGLPSTSATLWLWGDLLRTWADNPKCTTPFLGGETDGMQEVTVTPNTVKTCNLYFLMYRDANRNGTPESGEVLYETHDLYSYATEAFSYRFVSPDGHSTETGTRTKGWSLVRHQVLQPSATPNRYLVTMNSVPQTDEALPIRLHESTDYFTSQSLTGGHR
ncbi:hypothetical protein [Deinococcus apachensis]|uniref:hypothetical protein n=1 Tax=Deinococcus apachensis TaxID=309886 RepID=UPI000373B938|nr:hypothetical protein [Deinococcus apachensis]